MRESSRAQLHPGSGRGRGDRSGQRLRPGPEIAVGRHQQAGHPRRGSPQPEHRRPVAQGMRADHRKPGPGNLGAPSAGASGRAAPVGAGAEPPGTPTGASLELRRRYTAADLAVFTRDEASRFVPPGDGDPEDDIALAWELLYRLEPELYDRLASAER